MEKIQRSVIHHSVSDVIGLLENQPVQADMFPDISIAKYMNRISLAHLSIERAMKFLIMEAGQTYEEKHHLPLHLKTLRECESETVEFLECAFDDAVQHYRFNSNKPGMGHLKSLVAYLEVVGSEKVFNNIRYWELKQSPDAILLHLISLNLHLELLHALSEVLLKSERLKDTVSMRVERVVRGAMSRDINYLDGSEKELAVKSYLEWYDRSGFANCREAIATAFKDGSVTGDDAVAKFIKKAHQELIQSADPAVWYFADTLDILPIQRRDVIPCVEWLGPTKELCGSVTTPAGTHLGKIERCHDGLWRITPGYGRVVKAKTQTDARCYLAAWRTKPVQVTVNGQTECRRVVAIGESFIQKEDYSSVLDQRYEVTFWDKEHGLEIGNAVKVELPDIPESLLVTIIKGDVIEVAEHRVYIRGSEVWDYRP